MLTLKGRPEVYSKVVMLSLSDPGLMWDLIKGRGFDAVLVESEYRHGKLDCFAHHNCSDNELDIIKRIYISNSYKSKPSLQETEVNEIARLFEDE